ncbi:hypothetical protein Mapa_008313 [Marchantia paleacea]|nr:hypothetical protein Mapa_008313 [Marchantia paleacea]
MCGSFIHQHEYADRVDRRPTSLRRELLQHAEENILPGQVGKPDLSDGVGFLHNREDVGGVVCVELASPQILDELASRSFIGQNHVILGPVIAGAQKTDALGTDGEGTPGALGNASGGSAQQQIQCQGSEIVGEKPPVVLR